MKTYFVISDIHGFYTLMKEALIEAGFDTNNPEHILISCGDLLDRGEQPLECLSFVNSISDDRKFLIRGNHEDLLAECLVRKEFGSHDYHNGTVETVTSLCNGKCRSIGEVFDTAATNPEYVKYRNSLMDYCAIGKYIFVHGWIPVKLEYSKDGKFDKLPELYRPMEQVKDENWRNGDWYQSRWLHGTSMWKKGITVRGKTIVCGHWHTSEAHAKYHGIGSEWGDDACFDIFRDKGIIALDACTAYSKKVNVLKLTEDEIYGKAKGDN